MGSHRPRVKRRGSFGIFTSKPRRGMARRPIRTGWLVSIQKDGGGRRGARCIAEAVEAARQRATRRPVAPSITSRSERERGGLTGVQSTRMLCMQMRSDRPIGYPVLQASSSQFILLSFSLSLSSTPPPTPHPSPVPQLPGPGLLSLGLVARFGLEKMYYISKSK